jgi:hypothetical protein
VAVPRRKAGHGFCPLVANKHQSGKNGAVAGAIIATPRPVPVAGWPAVPVGRSESLAKQPSGKDVHMSLFHGVH